MEILYFIVVIQLIVSLYLSWKVNTLENESQDHYMVIGYILTETGIGEKAKKFFKEEE